MWPRWSDNVMYTNFGASGWNIRNNGSSTVMFMQHNGLVSINGGPAWNGNTKLAVNGVIRAWHNIESGGTTACWTNGSSSGGNSTAGLGICSSDIRLKKDIQDLPSDLGLKAVLKLRPVSFRWKEQENGRESLGFIAQEFEQIIPQPVSKTEHVTLRLPDGTEEEIQDSRSMNFQEIFAPVVKAIQELYGIIVDQGRIVDTHEAEISALKADNAAKEEKIQSLTSYLCTKDPQAPFCK